MPVFRTSSALATLASNACARGWRSAKPTRYGRIMIQPMASLFDGPFTTVTNRIRESDSESEFFKTIDQVFDKTTRMDPTTFHRRMINRFGQTKNGLRYEVTDTDEHIKIAFDVPGVDANEIDVLVENDGKILTVRGSRESKGDGYSFNSNFSKSFYIDSLVDIDQMKAQLENGVLIVSAPKDAKRLEANTKKIPVVVTSQDQKSDFGHESEKKHDIEVKNNDSREDS